jgi:hypothetical protein
LDSSEEAKHGKGSEPGSVLAQSQSHKMRNRGCVRKQLASMALHGLPYNTDRAGQRTGASTIITATDDKMLGIKIVTLPATDFRYSYVSLLSQARVRQNNIRR